MYFFLGNYNNIHFETEHIFVFSFQKNLKDEVNKF